MIFVTMPAAAYELGWRHTDSPPEEAVAGLSGFLPLTDPASWRSPHRTAALASFEIAAETIPLADLVGSPYALDDSIRNIATLCDLVDGRLAASGLRLP